MTMSTESLPFDEETAGTGIINGDGSAEQLASGGEDDSQVADSLQDQNAGASYDERLREGGEFAEQEVKNWERKFGKANSERDTLKKQLDSLQSLLPIVEQLGGSQNVIGSLERFGRVLGDEKLRHAIERYEQTGTFSAGQDEAEEYVDPLEAELRKENAALNARIARLEGSSIKQDGVLAKQRLKGHFQSAIKAYPFTQEELAKIEGGIESHIKQWSQNEQGIRALETLDETSVERLVRTQLDPDEWVAVVRRMDENRREEKGRLATDAPSTTATDRATIVAQTPLEACREAFKQEGKDPRGRLIP